MTFIETSLYLKPTDTVGKALEMFSLNNLKQIPVLKEDIFLGLLCEEDLMSLEEDVKVNKVELEIPNIIAKEDDHILELMKKSSENEFKILPIFNENRKYVGFLNAKEIFKDFIHHSPVSEPGAILIIEMQKRDYYLSELARIIESENISVLSMYVTSSLTEKEKIEVTIKVNKQDIYFLKSTLERFGYHLKASFSDVKSSDIMKERYESLMAYLNV